MSKKTSALPDATLPLSDSDIMYVVQGGNSRKVSVSGMAYRRKLSANLNLYVNGSTGSDSNDGLSSGAAFATLQKAADVAFGDYDLGGYDITINVAAGTYTAGVWVNAPQVGTGSIIFQGDTTTPSNCTINVTGASAFRASAGAKLHVRGFKLNMAGSTFQVLAEYSGLIYLDGKNEHAGTAGHRIAATYGGSVSTTAEEVISGTVPGSHYIALGGHIYCQGATWTGSGTPTQASFAQAGNAGLIFAFANSSTGSFTGSRYNANANGVIRVNGGGASYFPGSTAGSTSSGGQYL